MICRAACVFLFVLLVSNSMNAIANEAREMARTDGPAPWRSMLAEAADEIDRLAQFDPVVIWKHMDATAPGGQSKEPHDAE